MAHPIDRWVEAKIERALLDSQAVDPAASRHFQEKIEPILQTHCQRCHGEKAQGGLQLHRLDSALRGGDSGVPGIVPGRPEASELMSRVRSQDESVRMPPTGPALAAEQVALLEAWIADGAVWPGEKVRAEEVQLADLCRDDEFL
ncbi:MAG: c-type cytochrome domain-containing protein, partial [Pirellulaceae bacterium]